MEGVMGFTAKGSNAAALDDDSVGLGPSAGFQLPSAGFGIPARPPFSSTESLVRGQALRATVAALGSFFSASEVAEILSFLPTEAKQVVGGLAATRWYPLGWSIAIHHGARVVSNRGADLSYELGKQARKLDARGLYRFLLRFSSPEQFIRHSDRLMSLFADGPTIQFGPVLSSVGGEGTKPRAEGEPRRFRSSLRFDHCYAFDENIWQHALGSVDGLFELSGAQAYRVEVTDGGGNSPWLCAEVHWSR